MISDYTTAAEVRAVLGVTEEDLEDATLDLPFYESYLTMELEDIDVGLPTTYQTAKEKSTPSEAELRLVNTVKMFAAVALAKQLAGSLPMFAAKQVTDSKAGVQRFDNPYKDTINAIKNDYDRMRNRLNTALAAIGSTAGTNTSRVYVLGVSPATNPVTGS